MADHENTPAASELVYVPRPSWGPPFFALGAALIVVGIYGEGFMVRGSVYMIVGTVVILAALNSMIRAGIRDFYSRPLSQRASTAVLPAGKLRAPRKQS